MHRTVAARLAGGRWPVRRHASATRVGLGPGNRDATRNPAARAQSGSAGRAPFRPCALNRVDVPALLLFQQRRVGHTIATSQAIRLRRPLRPATPGSGQDHVGRRRPGPGRAEFGTALLAPGSCPESGRRPRFECLVGQGRRVSEVARSRVADSGRGPRGRRSRPGDRCRVRAGARPCRRPALGPGAGLAYASSCPGTQPRQHGMRTPQSPPPHGAAPRATDQPVTEGT
jgi:hypothetical protein